MSTRYRTPEETYAAALEKARQDFARADPLLMAARASSRYTQLPAGRGRFDVPFFGTGYHVWWPESSVERASDGVAADVTTRLILLHYLLTADGAPMASRWIAFRNLPGGLGYQAAFERRANARLAYAFGTDLRAFESAARALGGERLTFGDAAFAFRVLPCLWMAVVLNVSDEEFPANASVLFDGAASHYLPTEDLAVLGGLLAGRLIKSRAS